MRSDVAKDIGTEHSYSLGHQGKLGKLWKTAETQHVAIDWTCLCHNTTRKNNIFICLMLHKILYKLKSLLTLRIFIKYMYLAIYRV